MHVKVKALGDINLLDVGNTIQVSGIIYSGNGHHYYCFLPGEFDPSLSDTLFLMNLDEWKKFIRQTDLLETEILAKDTEDKLVKTIVRKTERMIDTRMQWRVFKRDGYKCRYCGNDDTPLTVDHLVLWENGGPTVDENLVSACKKCNKTRGSMEFVDWLNSPYYNKVARNLSDSERLANEDLIDTLPSIEKRVHIKSR